MEIKNLILKEIKNIPESYHREVLDFIRYLGTKTSEQNLEIAVVSESSLKKDWLKSEEDETWKDL